jgi:hypothetical protein
MWKITWFGVYLFDSRVVVIVTLWNGADLAGGTEPEFLGSCGHKEEAAE